MEAERALLVDVGGDLNHESLTSTTNIKDTHFERSQTTLARKALFHVKGEDGKLHLSANNLNAQGADVINDGKGDTVIQAKNDVNLTALSVGYDEKLGTGNHYRHEKVEKAVVSSVKGKGDVTLTGKNIRTEGAALESDAKLLAVAENDLVLNGAKESDDLEEFHKTKSGSVAKVTKTSFDKQQSETQRGTQVSGKEVVLAAGHDVKGKGLQAIAENDLLIQAGRDVDIAADTNHFKNIHKETKKTSGVFTSGGGITFGSKSEKHHLESEGWTQSDARSTLGSMNGNIKIQAGNHANVLGTDMITPRTNRIDIEGASVKVEAGKDIINTRERHEYKQSGLTLAVSTPVTDMAQAAYNSVKRSQQVTNPKLKALYHIKAAEEVAMAAQNVGKVAETLDALRAGNMQQTGTTTSPSIKVSVSYGNQKQTQTSESQSISHQKSTLSTGTLNVKARDEKLTFEGVDANAKLMALSGKKGIDIKGVKDEEHQRTENKSVGGSVGVFVGTNGNSYGFGIEGSVNVAKGKSNSDSERWQNSHLNADKIITNSEEGGLNLDAANLNAKRWEADIQHLTLTSRQDTEKYESKQTSAGASGSVAYGSGGGASVNAAYSKAKVDYAQVREQTGIQVGEGGMDVTVHHHTQLNGAIIDSEADASKNRFKTQSISSTDIENKSEIKTESASISAGSGGINPMQALNTALSLLGNSHESDRSQTKSAISANINIETETPENLTALSRDTQNANQKVKAFDLTEIKEQQEAAQVAGELFSKITGDVAKKFKFEDGSKEKIIMHAIAGALAAKVADGNVATGAAAGAASEWLNTYVADYLKEQTQDLNLTPQQKEKLRQAAQQVTALAIGAVAGAATGGSTDSIKQGALASYNAETYNRQLHPNEIHWIKENAQRFADEQGIEVAEAESLLMQQAARQTDILWFLSLRDETDSAARDFLAKQTNKTFVDSKGNVQNYFVAKDNDFTRSRIYEDEAYRYNRDNNQIINRTLTENVVRTPTEGLTQKLGDGFEYIKNNKAEVAKAVAKGMYESAKDCVSSPINCGTEFVGDIWTSVSTGAEDLTRSAIRQDLTKLNSLYGRDVEGDLAIAASINLASGVLDLVGTGKVAKAGIKKTVEATNKAIDKALFETTSKVEIGELILDGTDSPKVSHVKDVELSKSTTDIKDRDISSAVDNHSTHQNLNIVCGVGDKCFVAGTLIETVNGLKPIEEIQYGELIWSREEFGEKYAYKPVFANKVTLNQETFEVIVKNHQGKTETFFTTAEHPFFVEGRGWLKAILLEEGMTLLDRNGKPSLHVVSQGSTGKVETVYNIAVEDFSTYHIGELGIWVHNANCCDFVNKKYGDVEAKFKEGGWVNPKNDKVMYIDPFDGKFKEFPDGAITSVDHILPQKEFKNIPGFNKLPKNIQNELINDPMNLQPLPKELNSSKGAKIETGTDGWRKYIKENKDISLEYRDYLKRRQNAMTVKVMKTVEGLGVKK